MKLEDFQKELTAATTPEAKREVMSKGILMGKEYAQEITETAKLREYHPMVFAAMVFSLHHSTMQAMPEMLQAIETLHVLGFKAKKKEETNEPGQDQPAS